MHILILHFYSTGEVKISSKRYFGEFFSAIKMAETRIHNKEACTFGQWYGKHAAIF